MELWYLIVKYRGSWKHTKKVWSVHEERLFSKAGTIRIPVLYTEWQPGSSYTKHVNHRFGPREKKGKKIKGAWLLIPTNLNLHVWWPVYRERARNTQPCVCWWREGTHPQSCQPVWYLQVRREHSYCLCHTDTMPTSLSQAHCLMHFLQFPASQTS